MTRRYDEDFWKTRAPDGRMYCELSGEELGSLLGVDGGGVRRAIRRNRPRYPNMPWYWDVRQGDAAGRDAMVKRADSRIIDTLSQRIEVLTDALTGVQRELEAERELDLSERVERDSTVTRLRIENRELKQRYGVTLNRGALHEVVLDAVRDSIPSFGVPRIVAPKPSTSKHTTQDAILAWADWHAGERIDYEVMTGLNSYDPIICARRVQATVDTAIELLFEHHSGTTFEHLFIFDLGDTVTGDLLEDNKATNPMGVFDSFRFAAEIKARAIAELSAYLPVTYVAVPGNHGRRGQKMPWKQPTETADWLIAEMVKLHLRGNDRVECIIPRAWSAVVKVRGHNHWLNHGYAAAKGGNGGIPWYSYLRRDGKMTAIEQGRDERIHVRWYGHIHTPAEIPKMGGSGEQFIVGSLKGGDEYALNELGEYGDPVQKLVGAHEKRTFGVSFRYPLEVKHADSKPGRYEDAVGPGCR